MNKKILFLIVCLLVLISCSPAIPEDSDSEEAQEPAPATNTPQPLPTDTPPTPTEPQRVEFNAEDGIALIGYHYPAQVSNSPIIVLMHWARGDQKEWVHTGFVDWLTHRSLAGFAAQFPSMSYSVFTFDFRGFGESAGQFDPAGWLMDAKAAYETAKSLPGVDPAKIVGIGSSIGADAVVNACGTLCKGALSLSPGGYLNIPYGDAVASLNQSTANSVNILCIASEDDRESAPACKSASGEFYQSLVFPGSAHGTEFLSIESARMEIIPKIVEWLSATLP